MHNDCLSKSKTEHDTATEEISFTNRTARNNITEILLKVALYTKYSYLNCKCFSFLFLQFETSTNLNTYNMKGSEAL
jgi:hypothetical protein